MSDSKSNGPALPPEPPTANLGPSQIILTERRESAFSRVLRWFGRLVLVGSLAANVILIVAYREFFTSPSSAAEQYHSGDKTAEDRVVLIHITGTIMPPFTKRVLRSIEKAKNDDKVKGVVLVIDSPGGLVADSHQIYHRLVELREKKPIVVSMKSLAASGGYYVAMGAGEEGTIFAEPTTWTGSIGVIIPRYEVVELASKLGIDSKPLKTGKFKDALNPFRVLTADEEAVWKNILDQSFDRFLNVIADNRKRLDYDQTKLLATGEIYTADDAKKNGLVDEIGYEEDAIAHLKKRANLEKARVVTYLTPPAFLDLILGSSESLDPGAQTRALLEATVPRAMYFFSWGSSLPPLWSQGFE